MILSTAGMGTSGNTSRMSKLALRFYLSTTFLACVEGLVFFNMFTFAFHAKDNEASNSSDVNPGQLILGASAGPRMATACACT